MRNIVIVDANIAIKWVLNEEDSSTALALLNEWNKNKITMLAPFLFTYEVTNVLYQNMRKGKITLNQAKRALVEVLSLGVELEFFEHSALSKRALELAYQFNLPATYDPHYLALAERESCECWTADARLSTAVKGQLSGLRILADYHTPQN